jgi:hypothetical protein
MNRWVFFYGGLFVSNLLFYITSKNETTSVVSAIGMVLGITGITMYWKDKEDNKEEENE